MRFTNFPSSVYLGNLKEIGPKFFKRDSGSMITRPLEGKYAVDNLGINCLRTGTGHNVFFLPGSLGTIWTDFGPQIEGFNLNKYSLNVWDPPGYGNSRPPERQFGPKFYEQDALWAAKLIRKLKIGPCSLVGWSDGGITALIIAAKYPDLVNKLVVWGANSYVTEVDVKCYKSIQDISNWSPTMRNKLSSVYGEDHVQYLMNQWVESMIYIKDRLRGEICSEILGEIKAPTLILHGRKDPLVPHFHVQHLYLRIPDASIHYFPEGKHNIHIKYAKEFNQVVQKFLYGL